MKFQELEARATPGTISVHRRGVRNGQVRRPIGRIGRIGRNSHPRHSIVPRTPAYALPACRRGRVRFFFRWMVV